jgi:hypothetical protein
MRMPLHRTVGQQTAETRDIWGVAGCVVTPISQNASMGLLRVAICPRRRPTREHPAGLLFEWKFDLRFLPEAECGPALLRGRSPIYWNTATNEDAAGGHQKRCG